MSLSARVVRDKGVLALKHWMSAACRAVTAAPGTRYALECCQWVSDELTAGGVQVAQGRATLHQIVLCNLPWLQRAWLCCPFHQSACQHGPS